jgi:hypothetical protein
MRLQNAMEFLQECEKQDAIYSKRYPSPSTAAPAQESPPGPKPAGELRGLPVRVRVNLVPEASRIWLPEMEEYPVSADLDFRPDSEAREAWGIPTDSLYEVATSGAKPGSATVSYY